MGRRLEKIILAILLHILLFIIVFASDLRLKDRRLIIETNCNANWCSDPDDSYQMKVRYTHSSRALVNLSSIEWNHWLNGN